MAKKFEIPVGVGYPTPDEALAALKAASVLTLPDRAVRVLFRLTGDQARRAEGELTRVARANKYFRGRRKAIVEEARRIRRAARLGPRPGSGIHSIAKREWMAARQSA